MTNANTEFELGGVHHLALVCRDMARTVDFYRGVLGMPLVLTIDLPHGMGQHFFFDIGNGDCLAFFWYPEAPEPAPGVSAPASFPIIGDSRSAMGSMNHVAITVPPEKFDEYVDKLHAKGIETSGITNHDDSENQVTRRMHDGVFLRSVYFFDPDGALLEFACWTRELGEQDVGVAPAHAVGAGALPR
ncbi:MAG TPA: VOC family protein [Acidimicrobiales bacterium]|jgi:catechol 2,3-dioxygenase-like lactoylglutathione lyase family enzyme|nr:VOC family protein [Acidimicrobiales bacterium]